MIYIGMDVSSKSFVVYVIDGRKKKIFSGEVSPTRVGLRKLIKDVGGANKLVIFEAGNQIPEGFFQRLDCFEKIKCLRISDVQKGIF